TGLRRASAVLLLCHMQQRSAAFHAADAAYTGDDHQTAPILKSQPVGCFVMRAILYSVLSSDSMLI
ncbi:hypothetical protein ACR6AT_005030, partial [Escherichia coli]